MVDEQFEATLFEKVGKIFRKDPSELSRETRFAEDLRAGSQGMFALAATLGRMTGTAVSFTDVNQCATLGEALDFADNLSQADA
ncbi:MAG: hypothetical protein KDB60_00375 [Propionibacteriaceae bacterium]|nr:hypothetical protein [Propionibacteriaceae bacterium]